MRELIKKSWGTLLTHLNINRMMLKVCLFLTMLLFFSCGDSSDKLKNENVSSENYSNIHDTIKHEPSYRLKDIDGLKLFVLNYKPSHIDISKDINDTLKYYDLNFILEEFSSDSILEISRILLLKQYLYHLKRSNQGYNLYTMREGKAKVIIDYYLLNHDIDTTGEFLNSGYIWKMEKHKDNPSPQVQRLIRDIELEKERIEKSVDETIRKYE